MGIRFRCTACSSKYDVDDQWAGQEITCGGCGSVLAVPGLAAPPAGDPGPEEAGLEPLLADGDCPRCGKARVYGPGHSRLPIPMGPGIGEGPVIEYACHHCGYVECYLGETRLLTKIRTKWPRAKAPKGARFLDGAMRAGDCPKCASGRVYSSEKVEIKNLLHMLYFPNRKIYPNSLDIARGGAPLENFVCSQCAYMERYVAHEADVRRLSRSWPASLKEREMTFTGPTLRQRKCPKCGGGKIYGDSRSRAPGGYQIYLTKPAPGSSHSAVPVNQFVCASCGYLERFIADSKSRHLAGRKWPAVRRIR